MKNRLINWKNCFVHWAKYSHVAFLTKVAFVSVVYAGGVFTLVLVVQVITHNVEDTARVDPKKKVVVSISLAGREVALTFKTEEDAQAYFNDMTLGGQK